MTRANRSRFARFSQFRYLADPALPQSSPILLGIVVEVVFAKQWFVGITVRSRLAPNELTLLDGIGRELLQNPFELLKREVEGLLPIASKPGDILRTLAATKTWSLNVAPAEDWKVGLPSDRYLDGWLKERMAALWSEILKGSVASFAVAGAPRGRRRQPPVASGEPGRFFSQGDSWRVRWPIAA